MRASKRRIIAWTATRGTLGRLAGILCQLEKDEAAEVLATLVAELECLQHGDATAEVWRQATADLDGPQVYGLQRIGLWPDGDD